MNGKLTHTLEEVKRVRWPLVISIAVMIILDHTLAFRVFYKVATVCVAFIVAHICRQQVMPYLDYSEALNSSTHSAIGASIVVGLIYASFIIGVALGL